MKKFNLKRLKKFADIFLEKRKEKKSGIEQINNLIGIQFFMLIVLAIPYIYYVFSQEFAKSVFAQAFFMMPLWVVQLLHIGILLLIFFVLFLAHLEARKTLRLFEKWEKEYKNFEEALISEHIDELVTIEEDK
jgi:fucose 4-O-acetylase-like acetyltransferase